VTYFGVYSGFFCISAELFSHRRILALRLIEKFIYHICVLVYSMWNSITFVINPIIGLTFVSS
jgi:hypothetical protein